MSSGAKAVREGDGAHLVAQTRASGPNWITGWTLQRVFSTDDEIGLGVQRPALAAEWAGAWRSRQARGALSRCHSCGAPRSRD